jgi:hypothetical protein
MFDLERLKSFAVQMADYFNCKEQKKEISEWLLTAATAVSQHNEESGGEMNRRSSTAEPAKKRKCTRFSTAHYWHFTRVCV